MNTTPPSSHRIYIDDVIEPLGWFRSSWDVPYGDSRHPLQCWSLAKLRGSFSHDPRQLEDVISLVGGQLEGAPAGHYYIHIPPP
jgi:hypothetical protein